MSPRTQGKRIEGLGQQRKEKVGDVSQRNMTQKSLFALLQEVDAPSLDSGCGDGGGGEVGLSTIAQCSRVWRPG